MKKVLGSIFLALLLSACGSKFEPIRESIDVLKIAEECKAQIDINKMSRKDQQKVRSIALLNLKRDMTDEEFLIILTIFARYNNMCATYKELVLSAR